MRPYSCCFLTPVFAVAETFTVDELSYVFANLDIGIVLTKPEV
jgi:hypothetical protein